MADDDKLPASLARRLNAIPGVAKRLAWISKIAKRAVVSIPKLEPGELSARERKRLEMRARYEALEGRDPESAKIIGELSVRKAFDCWKNTFEGQGVGGNTAVTS